MVVLICMFALYLCICIGQGTGTGSAKRQARGLWRGRPMFPRRGHERAMRIQAFKEPLIHSAARQAKPFPPAFLADLLIYSKPMKFARAGAQKNTCLPTTAFNQRFLTPHLPLTRLPPAKASISLPKAGNPKDFQVAFGD